MTISKRMIWGAGLALVLGTTALVAQGYGPMMGGGPGYGHMGGGMMGGGFWHMARFLNLTEAQQTKVKAIEDSHRASLEAKFKTAGEAREALHKAMVDPAANDAQIKDLHARMADAMTGVMLERRAMQREFEAILTPDQKAALEKQRADWGPRGGRMGRGMMGGGCPGWGGF